MLAVAELSVKYLHLFLKLFFVTYYYLETCLARNIQLNFCITTNL